MTEAIRVGIAGIASYLPPKVYTNKDFEKMVDTSDEWITERTGIKERHIVEGEANSDMVAKVALQLLKESGLRPDEVDCIICATFTPDRPLPTNACYVQAKIGASKAAVFDMAAACSGFLYGLKVGGALVATGAYKNVLVFGSEVLSSIANYRDRTTCVLFGDGCGGALLQPWREGHHEMLSIELGADGSAGDILYIPAGGQLMPLTHELLDQNMHKVIMNGNALFKRACRAMVDSTQSALEKANLKLEDITWLVPHQANIRILETTARMLNIPKERVFINLERTGNTSSASIPIALDEASGKGLFKKNDIIAMCAFGGGLTWGGAVMRW
ncbi:MAG: beta-ketoacyl-ACP synthase III [Candidatus Brocadiia bacterium]